MGELLSLEEVAELFHVRPQTVISRVRQRLLPAPVKTANGTNPILFTRAKIMRAVAEHYREKKLTQFDRIIRWLPKLPPEQIDELRRTIDEDRESRVTFNQLARALTGDRRTEAR